MDFGFTNEVDNMMKTLANKKIGGGLLILMAASQFNMGPVKANNWMTEPDLLPDAIPLVGRYDPSPMHILALLSLASGVALLMD